MQGLVLAAGAVAVGEDAFVRSPRGEGDQVGLGGGGGGSAWMAFGDGECSWERGEDGEGCRGEMHGWVGGFFFGRVE